MNKLAVYGLLGRQEEVQLLAEIKLHPDLPVTSETRRGLVRQFANRGAEVLSIQVHREAVFELA